FIGQENGKSRLQQTQEEVEEVKVIMLDNLNKAEERSGKLGELENRADKLKTFEKTSNQVKRKKMWENKRMKLLFIVVGVVAALILFGLIIYAIVG
uniref:Vesicle-associated membrane protein 5-like n=1 Tax=Seriola dumerili TaxID=41447 RepID=A0A3B4TKZ8_SERDU